MPRPGRDGGTPAQFVYQVNEFPFLNWYDAMTGLAGITLILQMTDVLYALSR